MGISAIKGKLFYTTLLFLFLIQSCSENEADNLDASTYPQDFALTNPKLGATDLHPGFAFEWTESAEAVSYELHIGETFEADELIITGLTQTNHTVNDLRYGKTYFWKVVGVNASGQKAESIPLSFETKTNWFILDHGFPIPQLSSETTVRMYLPPSYKYDMKDYPVLYMFDGFWIFGELSNTPQVTWKVDEQLDIMFQETGSSLIIVAIDTQLDRDNLLSPWVSQGTIDPSSAGYGGNGDELTEFIVQNLKPFIDARYRTLSDKNNTGILGASLGGLMASYAVFEYPEVFGRGGLFSPSYWYADENMYELASENLGLLDDHLLYFLVGSTDLSQIKMDMDRMVGFLDDRGFTNYKTKTYPGGHTNSTWGGGIREAIEWLFQQ